MKPDLSGDFLVLKGIIMNLRRLTIHRFWVGCKLLCHSVGTDLYVIPVSASIQFALRGTPHLEAMEATQLQMT